MRCVTLTTDFGDRDGFVGMMKAVILGQAGNVPIVDLAHGLDPGDIRSAAFVLMSSFGYFPRGSVHLAVVDPGVGSRRRALAVSAGGHYFVGPDNGVLSWAVAGKAARIIELTDKRRHLRPVSRTFHGRDIFAPAAAALAKGAAISSLGKRRRGMKALDFPGAVFRRGGLEGEGLVVDRFGNLVSSLSEKDCAARFKGRKLLVRAGGRTFPLVASYSSAGKGEALALFGSAGFLEISVRGDSAAKAMGLGAGSRVRVEPA